MSTRSENNESLITIAHRHSLILSAFARVSRTDIPFGVMQIILIYHCSLIRHCKIQIVSSPKRQCNGYWLACHRYYQAKDYDICGKSLSTVVMAHTDQRNEGKASIFEIILRRYDLPCVSLKIVGGGSSTPINEYATIDQKWQRTYRDDHSMYVVSDECGSEPQNEDMTPLIFRVVEHKKCFLLKIEPTKEHKMVSGYYVCVGSMDNANDIRDDYALNHRSEYLYAHRDKSKAAAFQLAGL